MKYVFYIKLYIEKNKIKISYPHLYGKLKEIKSSGLWQWKEEKFCIINTLLEVDQTICVTYRFDRFKHCVKATQYHKGLTKINT